MDKSSRAGHSMSDKNSGGKSQEPSKYVTLEGHTDLVSLLCATTQETKGKAAHSRQHALIYAARVAMCIERPDMVFSPVGSFVQLVAGVIEDCGDIDIAVILNDKRQSNWVPGMTEAANVLKNAMTEAGFECECVDERTEGSPSKESVKKPPLGQDKGSGKIRKLVVKVNEEIVDIDLTNPLIQKEDSLVADVNGLRLGWEKHPTEKEPGVLHISVHNDERLNVDEVKENLQNKRFSIIAKWNKKRAEHITHRVAKMIYRGFECATEFSDGDVWVDVIKTARMMSKKNFDERSPGLRRCLEHKVKDDKRREYVERRARKNEEVQKIRDNILTNALQEFVSHVRLLILGGVSQFISDEEMNDIVKANSEHDIVNILSSKRDQIENAHNTAKQKMLEYKDVKESLGWSRDDKDEAGDNQPETSRKKAKKNRKKARKMPTEEQRAARKKMGEVNNALELATKEVEFFTRWLNNSYLEKMASKIEEVRFRFVGKLYESYQEIRSSSRRDKVEIPPDKTAEAILYLKKCLFGERPDKRNTVSDWRLPVGALALYVRKLVRDAEKMLNKKLPSRFLKDENDKPILTEDGKRQHVLVRMPVKWSMIESIDKSYKGSDTCCCRNCSRRKSNLASGTFDSERLCKRDRVMRLDYYSRILPPFIIEALTKIFNSTDSEARNFYMCDVKPGLKHVVIKHHKSIYRNSLRENGAPTMIHHILEDEGCPFTEEQRAEYDFRILMNEKYPYDYYWTLPGTDDIIQKKLNSLCTREQLDALERNRVAHDVDEIAKVILAKDAEDRQRNREAFALLESEKAAGEEGALDKWNRYHDLEEKFTGLVQEKKLAKRKVADFSKQIYEERKNLKSKEKPSKQEIRASKDSISKLLVKKHEAEIKVVEIHSERVALWEKEHANNPNSPLPIWLNMGDTLLLWCRKSDAISREVFGKKCNTLGITFKSASMFPCDGGDKCTKWGCEGKVHQGDLLYPLVKRIEVINNVRKPEDEYASVLQILNDKYEESTCNAGSALHQWPPSDWRVLLKSRGVHRVWWSSSEETYKVGNRQTTIGGGLAVEGKLPDLETLKGAIGKRICRRLDDHTPVPACKGVHPYDCDYRTKKDRDKKQEDVISGNVSVIDKCQEARAKSTRLYEEACRVKELRVGLGMSPADTPVWEQEIQGHRLHRILHGSVINTTGKLLKLANAVRKMVQHEKRQNTMIVRLSHWKWLVYAGIAAVSEHFGEEEYLVPEWWSKTNHAVRVIGKITPRLNEDSNIGNFIRCLKFGNVKGNFTSSARYLFYKCDSTGKATGEPLPPAQVSALRKQVAEEHRAQWWKHIKDDLKYVAKDRPVLGPYTGDGRKIEKGQKFPPGFVDTWLKILRKTPFDKDVADGELRKFINVTLTSPANPGKNVLDMLGALKTLTKLDAKVCSSNRTNKSLHKNINGKVAALEKRVLDEWEDVHPPLHWYIRAWGKSKGVADGQIKRLCKYGFPGETERIGMSIICGIENLRASLEEVRLVDNMSEYRPQQRIPRPMPRLALQAKKPSKARQTFTYAKNHNTYETFLGKVTKMADLDGIIPNTVKSEFEGVLGRYLLAPEGKVGAKLPVPILDDNDEDCDPNKLFMKKACEAFAMSAFRLAEKHKTMEELEKLTQTELVKWFIQESRTGSATVIVNSSTQLSEKTEESETLSVTVGMNEPDNEEMKESENPPKSANEGTKTCLNGDKNDREKTMRPLKEYYRWLIWASFGYGLNSNMYPQELHLEFDKLEPEEQQFMRLACRSAVYHYKHHQAPGKYAAIRCMANKMYPAGGDLSEVKTVRFDEKCGKMSDEVFGEYLAVVYDYMLTLEPQGLDPHSRGFKADMETIGKEQSDYRKKMGTEMQKRKDNLWKVFEKDALEEKQRLDAKKKKEESRVKNGYHESGGERFKRTQMRHTKRQKKNC